MITKRLKNIDKYLNEESKIKLTSIVHYSLNVPYDLEELYHYSNSLCLSNLKMYENTET